MYWLEKTEGTNKNGKYRDKKYILISIIHILLFKQNIYNGWIS
jgi:hypothetical protein